MSALPFPNDRPSSLEERAAFALAGKQLGSAVEPLPYTLANDVEGVSRKQPVIQGLIDCGAFAGLIGPSGGGKSTVGVHAACCIGADTPFFGRPVTPGISIYLAAEGGASISQRILAWKLRHAVDGTAVAIVTVTIDLSDPSADTGRVIATARELETRLGQKVVAVFADTVARVFGAGDENSAADMGLFVANCDRIRLATGAAVVAIHHTGKNEARGARGSNSFHAALDTLLEVSNNDGVVSIVAAKQRDLPSGETFAGKLVPVAVGKDAWGEITACIVEPIDATNPAPERRSRAPKPPKGTGVALDALREVIRDHGQMLAATSTNPGGTKAITGELCRSRYYTMDPLSPDDNSEDATKRAEKARRKRFERVRANLQESKIIGGRNDQWWIW